ncbi:helix-turn-helix domain-containing protein [Clostridium sp.]
MKQNKLFKLILMQNRILQKSISVKSGVSESHISRYINGQRNLSNQVVDNICLELIGMKVKKSDLREWKNMYLKRRNIYDKKNNRIV